MFYRRYLICALFVVFSVCQSFGAEVVLTPSPPERGKTLHLEVKVPEVSNPTITEVKWSIKRKFEGESEAVTPSQATGNPTSIDAIEPGDYLATVTFKVDGKASDTFESFTVLSERHEQAQAADEKLEKTDKITEATVKNYIKAKIVGDTKHEYTAFLLSKKLKEIIKNNEHVDNREEIYKDMRSGVEEVVDQRSKEDAGPDVNPRAAMIVKQALNTWKDANEHLIERLNETTSNASEVLTVLNEAVLPALGAESVPLSERTPDVPVPPLSADTMARILQQSRRGTTVPASSRRRSGCCLGILLGF